MVSVFCIFCSCNGGIHRGEADKEIQIKDSLQIKANQLSEAYNKNNYFGFFKLFPDHFDEFLKLYGFDAEKGGMPLYQVYEKHIHFFFASYALHQEYFIPKLFNLAKEGHWEADATGILRDDMEKFITLHTKEVVAYLATKPDKKVASFWRFVFDGSGKYDLQNKEKFETIYGKVNPLDAKQGKLLKEEFERNMK
jgi:hypothetical protein